MAQDRDRDVGVVKLVDAGVPADHGLSSLGLLMQLGGSAFAAYASLVAFVVLFDEGGRGDSKWIFPILALCVTRSMFHRLAGVELLYRSVEGASQGSGSDAGLAGVRRYIVVAFAQTGLLGLMLAVKLQWPIEYVLAIVGALAAWPTTLVVLLAMPRFRPFAHKIPVSEDKGFEGASILMTILGLCGGLATATVVIVLLDLGGQTMQGPGVLVMLALVMLVIRSVIHVQAGVSGLRETSVDHSVELATRYANFGVISSFCTGGALLLAAMAARLNLSGLAIVGGVCWMLMAWPMIIRRFFSDRQFADLMAGEDAAVHRRAPDAGLTGLGWLLIGHAVVMASFTVPQIVMRHYHPTGSAAELVTVLGASGDRSMWWNVGVSVLEGWAGYELVRMSVQHRVITMVYAVIATLIALYIFWPAFRLLKDIHGASFDDSRFLIMLAPMAIQLVIPVAALILVNRTIAPMARARFRPRAPAPSAPA